MRPSTPTSSPSVRSIRIPWPFRIVIAAIAVVLALQALYLVADVEWAGAWRRESTFEAKQQALGWQRFGAIGKVAFPAAVTWRTSGRDGISLTAPGGDVHDYVDPAYAGWAFKAVWLRTIRGDSGNSFVLIYRRPAG